MSHSQSDAKPVVIVVDDELMVLCAVGWLLEEAGFEVVSTTSASEAARLVGECHPALVLTDLRMPGMNGIELASLIHHAEPSLPIVLMTAAASAEISDQARRAGAATVVEKPIDAPSLVSILMAEIRAHATRVSI